MPNEKNESKSSNNLVVKLPLAVLLILMCFALGKEVFWGRSGAWYENLRAEVVNTPYARTVSVSAEGKVVVKPDVAFVDVAVIEAGANLKEVMSLGNSKMNKLIEEMKGLGIAPEDLKTINYDLYPLYEQKPVVYGVVTEVSTPKIVGYNFSQTLNVKIRDLNKVDQVLDKASAAGVNQISGISFDVDDKTDLKKVAREKAFFEAKQKAEEMAGQVGVKLGRVVTFSEGFSVYPTQVQNFRYQPESMSMVGDSGAGIESGSKEFIVNVNVTYELN